MPAYAYRIVNVFADPSSPHSRLTGNPLCVFEDARGLDAATMQSLALQFNLSETVFVLPSDKATARIRIFTTAFEMPFAGHPTLGSAHVVRAITGAGDQVTLVLNPLRDGSKGGLFVWMKLPDGKILGDPTRTGSGPINVPKP